ncbi:LacI family DNA-binding transcriptional regulator [Cutibacterium avidum]|uniref:LacI family DNA-binding transcriptional regulator n=1 Tax=Cutibacterium avidum TaxID=33010 RepID=UPI0022E3BF1E|nr:LacI family DNA-binding transcriptional regulator [Cutibacterium avidum]MBS5744950.1 LacI family DNA-binding transcriptional regulator [Propionibacterium sp.]MDU2072312.1 LacI family DNA-binding transcriptional regulator [Cutibacterium avidum]MDU3219445.1 LacI family DNA-binding transcriptional regulator [Cutibacterium avidum]MDU3283569.1 LacI family DNA-binding transcriptional regulator [Cutibacterium avidum]MDU3726430.1 LacI family DNA-binding transcriptional regulator [Cutibacterium avid
MARVTISDVAAAAGVSTATVSRVINGIGNVNPGMRDRVSAAVNELHYRPNPTGRVLRQQRTDTVAVLMPDIKNPYFTEFTYFFESSVSAHNIQVSVGNTDESLVNEERYVASAIEQRSAGVVLAVASDRSEAPALIQEKGIPLVLFDRLVHGYTGASVSVDNRAAGAMAASHLFARGFQRPAVLTGSRRVSSTRTRADSFCDAAAKRGMVVDPELVVQTDTRELGAENAVWELIGSGKEFDCLFSTNGPLTMAAFRVLHEAGWTGYNRVGLIGVDDEFWTSLVTPRVTVIRQPVTEIGRMAAKLLIEQFGRGTAEGPRSVVLAPQLVVRESTMRV